MGCAIQEGFDIADGHLVRRERQARTFDRRRRSVEIEDRGGMGRGQTKNPRGGDRRSDHEVFFRTTSHSATPLLDRDEDYYCAADAQCSSARSRTLNRGRRISVPMRCLIGESPLGSGRRIR